MQGRAVRVGPSARPALSPVLDRVGERFVAASQELSLRPYLEQVIKTKAIPRSYR